MKGPTATTTTLFLLRDHLYECSEITILFRTEVHFVAELLEIIEKTLIFEKLWKTVGWLHLFFTCFMSHLLNLPIVEVLDGYFLNLNSFLNVARRSRWWDGRFLLFGRWQRVGHQIYSRGRVVARWRFLQFDDVSSCRL